MDLQTKIGSDFEADDATCTPRGFEEIYCLPNEALWK